MIEKKNSRRGMLRGVAAVMAAGGAAAGAAKAQTAEAKMEKKVYYPRGEKPKKTPLFSDTVSYGNLVFVSGKGAHYKGDIAAHTKTVLDELEKSLTMAGSSMEKVLKVTVFLAKAEDYKGMNEVFQGRFGENPPVRTTVAPAWVPGDSLVEMDVIAYL